MGSLCQRNNALRVHADEPLPQLSDFVGVIDSFGVYTLPVLFGDRLRELRDRKGLTQDSLAEKAGVSKGQVSRWERGEDANPGLVSIQQLATALDVVIADFFPRPEKDTGHGTAEIGDGVSNGTGLGVDPVLAGVLAAARELVDREDSAPDTIEGDILKAHAILTRAVHRIGRAHANRRAAGGNDT